MTIFLIRRIDDQEYWFLILKSYWIEDRRESHSEFKETYRLEIRTYTYHSGWVVQTLIKSKSILMDLLNSNVWKKFRIFISIFIYGAVKKLAFFSIFQQRYFILQFEYQYSIEWPCYRHPLKTNLLNFKQIDQKLGCSGVKKDKHIYAQLEINPDMCSSLWKIFNVFVSQLRY